MAVRNFWVDLDVDGRKSRVGTGPRNREGGMRATIYQREDGEISERNIGVASYVTGQGKLATRVDFPRGCEVVDNGDGTVSVWLRTDR